ncbi:ESPR-type extended signal peptide-containing protein [Veillonella sp. AF13-2]|uniref:ESPR-type extended signal peptide-containing protein n=1 Tax=Veillonella sp. AF13-2 TaxID=2293250 RepID=UPI000EEACCF9|nr:ESPR-type extended signal peptide-containing protein [Veillonella sp. AF13-2]RJV50443.1 S-layer protein [Veillonella sp. AF13-2]
MNRVYKVVYNRTKGQYEVVSELAKNGGKANGNPLLKSISTSAKGLSRALLVGMFLMGGICGVQAETINDGDKIVAGPNISVTKDAATNTITVAATGVATTAEMATATTNITQNKTDIGTNKAAIETNKTAIAANKTATETNKTDIAKNKAAIDTNKNAIAANTGSINTNKTNIQANTNDINTNKTNIQANTNDININKTNIQANTNDINTNKAAIGTNKTNIDKNKVAIDKLEELNTKLGLDPTKPGMKYFRANSTGDDAQALGDDAIAIGVKSYARAHDSLAIGNDARASGSASTSVAIGNNAVSGSFAGMTADGNSSVVVLGGGHSSVSIGDKANARGNTSIAMGKRATVYNDGANTQIVSNSMAIGTDAKTIASNNAIAIGNTTTVEKNSNSAIAIGDGTIVRSEAGVAIGKKTVASGEDSLSFGTEANAGSAGAVAMGKKASAGQANSVAIGTEALANAGTGIAIGNKAESTATGSVVVGNNAGKGMVGDLLGAKGSHVVIGDSAGHDIDGQQNIAIGYKTGEAVKSDHNVAIGSEAGTNIGSTGNTSEGKNVSIGYHANKNNAPVSRIQSTAIGSETIAADDAVAIGYQASANDNGATAIGFNARATGAASVAIGQGARSEDGNIALGNSSVATAAMNTGTGYLTGQAKPRNVVSVGDTGALRRIVNVADGSADQDAVTVAQLKRSIDDTVARVTNAGAGGAGNTGIFYDTVTTGPADNSITLRNTSGKGTIVRNVAPGVLDTDATNVKQVKELVDTSKTHYYSVKSSNNNNFNNDLASGVDSMAAGVSIKALGERSVAIGNNNEAQSTGSITLGVGYSDGNAANGLKQTLAVTGYEYNMAIGAGAQSAGNSSIAIGTLATSSIKNKGDAVDKAIAIGYSAGVSDSKAIAIGSDAKSNSKSASALGDTAQALANDALAIGTQAQASGSTSAAIGARSAVSGANTYVVGSDNSNNPAGTGATITATNSGVFGNQNRLEGNKNRLVGNSNTVKLESMALLTTPKKIEDVMITGNDNTVSGDPDASTQGDAGNILGISVTGSKNTIQAKNSGNKDLKNIGIVGNNNTIDTSNTARDLSDTQILGSDVTATLGNSVYLGSRSAYVAAGDSTKGMDAYTGNGTYNYAGGTPAGVVTVGSVGKERRIQNVAAGLVSNTSTDAINGSQLYNHTLPLRFGSDNSTIGATAAADNNVIHRGSNQAMSILGGANGNNLTDNNIGVVTEATNNKMTVKLAKDLNGLNTVNANTVKTGDTTMTTNGVTINNGPKIVKTGIDAGGKKITNVANGTDNSDAVNFGQLKSQSDALTAKGFGIKAEDGNKVHKALGEDVDVIGDGKNISTKVDGTSVRVAMKDDITVTSVTAQDGNGNKTVTNANGVTTEDNAGNKTVVNKDGITINKADPTGNKTVSLTGDGLNNGGNQIKNVKAGTDLTDAVNLAQLRQEISSNATKLVDGKNTTVEGDGSANNPYKVNVSDDLVLGKKGADGKDGSIGVNGKDGSAVVINGKDGSIGLNGKDGANGISIKGGEGKAGVDGTSITRLVVEEKNGTKHDVATLDDGMKYGGDTGNVINKKLNEQVNVVGGITDEGKLTTDDNIGVVSDGMNNLKVRLAKKLTGLESVTTGNTTIDTNGITINNGPSMTTNGINANSTRIQNVANGTSDTDAVNLGQLKSQSDALIAKGFGIKAEDGNKVHKALGEDVDVIGDGKNISTKVDGTSVRVTMKDDITVTSVTAQDGNGNKTVTNADGVTTEDNTGNKTVVNKDGITINKADPTGNKTVSLTGDGLNNGGNKITNVADGVDDKDAVNKSQLDNATAAATTTVTAGNNIIVTKTTNQNGSTNYEVALKDQVTLGSDPTKQIALDGTTGTIKAGDKVTIDGNKGNIIAGKVAIDGENGIIKAGDKVTIDGKDGKIDAGKIAVNGKDGYVTGLENKTFDPANIVSGRAATEDQLKASHDSLNQKITNMGDEITKKGMDFAGNTGEFHRDLGQKVTIKGEGTEADDKYSGENIKTVADQAGNITIKMAKNIKTDSVTTDKVKVGKDGQDGVSITGPNGADGTDGKVGISGKDGKDAVSMSGKDGIGHIGLNGKDGRSADITVEKGDPNLDDKEITRIKYKDEDGTTHQVATKDDGMKYGGDSGNVIKKKLNTQVNVKGGISDESKLTDEANIGVVSDGTDTLKLRLAKDLQGLNTVNANTVNATTVNATTVKTGDSSLNNNGLTIENGTAGKTVSVTKDGLDNGGNKIVNVAPGEVSANSTDAVNGSQLYGLSGRVSKLGTQINRVGASAAALAGLHPLDFDPDDKWDFAASYGNYKGTNAVAIGAYYRPNEDTMVSVGGSFSGGENMLNVGVSWKFSQNNTVSRSRVSIAKDVLGLKQQVEMLTKKLEAYESGQVPVPGNGSRHAMVFPDVPENHWAYQYVKTLGERGYLQGYPDGEFKGDRTLTRYEYAAIIYRALQNGAPADGNMARSVDEFGSELESIRNIDRFRVDRVSGGDNDRNKVERVRINDKDDVDQNDYRDNYGSRIEKAK